MASSRIGKNTGPGRLLSTAMNRAKASTTASATRNSSMLRRKPRSTSGNASRKRSPSKNASLTAGHPGACTTAKPATAKKTTVLISAMTTARRPSPCHAPPRIRERRSPGGSGPASPGTIGWTSGRPPPPLATDPGLLLDLGEGDPLQVLVVQSVECAVRLQGIDGAVHAGDERVPLLEHESEVFLRTDG